MLQFIYILQLITTMLNEKQHEQRINNITNIIWTITKLRSQIFILNQYINNSLFQDTKKEYEEILILNKQMLLQFIKQNNLIYLT